MTQPIFSRRGLLLGTGAGLLAAQRAIAATLAATPQQTEGPFYPVNFPTDMDNDLVQVRGQAAQAMGTVLHLEGRVLAASGRTMPGALIEIWQCDAQGGRERRDSAFQGYGRMLVDAEGRYSFRTLKPVAYPGRTPHIHFKVATAGSHLTSQFYIAGEAQNERDFVYREAARSAQQRERIEMRLQPASGLEPGALATSVDIVVG